MRRSVAAATLITLWLGASCAVPPGGGTRRGGGGLTDASPDGASTNPACVGVKCDKLECGAGLIPLPLPDECCASVCVPDDCSTVECPAANCLSGTHEAPQSGSCCTTCVTDTVQSAGTCEEGQTGYESFLAQKLASAEASNCNTDSDCRLVALDNLCGASCGTPVSVRGAAAVVSAANAYANAHCEACTTPAPCPPVEKFAVCSGGTCSAY